MNTQPTFQIRNCAIAQRRREGVWIRTHTQHTHTHTLFYLLPFRHCIGYMDQPYCVVDTQHKVRMLAYLSQQCAKRKKSTYITYFPISLYLSITLCLCVSLQFALISPALFFIAILAKRGEITTTTQSLTYVVPCSSDHARITPRRSRVGSAV